MTYEPRDGQLISVLVPDEPNEREMTAMVVRKASERDKKEWVERFKSRLKPGEEIEEESLNSWLFSDLIWICICQDEITMVHQDNITGPLDEPTEILFEKNDTDHSSSSS